MPTEQQILSEEQIAEIEARYQKATPGPWGVLPSNNSNLAHVETQEGSTAEQGWGFTVCSIPKKRIADAEFVAFAREDVPTLCQTVRALREKDASRVDDIGILQSRLSEVTKERDRLLEIAKGALRFRVFVNGSCNHDEYLTKLCTQCEIRSVLENLDHQGD